MLFIWGNTISAAMLLLHVMQVMNVSNLPSDNGNIVFPYNSKFR